MNVDGILKEQLVKTVDEPRWEISYSMARLCLEIVAAETAENMQETMTVAALKMRDNSYVVVVLVYHNSLVRALDFVVVLE